MQDGSRRSLFSAVLNNEASALVKAHPSEQRRRGTVQDNTID